MAAIWAWEHKQGRSLSWKASKWVLWSFLVVSFFSVWYNLRPRLYAEIQRKVSGANPNKLPIAILIVEVRNTGAPTSIHSWRLSVTTPDKKQHDGAMQGITGPVVTSDEQGRVTTYAAVDALYEKAFRDPMPEGKIMTGVLVYIFNGVTPSDLQDQRTKYSLKFEDTKGVFHEAVDMAKDRETQPRSYPGLTPP